MKRLAILLILLLLCLSACTAPPEANAPIAGFSFSHSGMHTGLIYTLSAFRTEDGWQAELSLLGGESQHVLAMTQEDAAGLTSLAEEYGLQKWAGFDKNNPRMLDGTAFSLTINYEDGKHLYARGSNAFPKNYRQAHHAIREFFNQLMQKNGIESPL